MSIKSVDAYILNSLTGTAEEIQIVILTGLIRHISKSVVENRSKILDLIGILHEYLNKENTEVYNNLTNVYGFWITSILDICENDNEELKTAIIRQMSEMRSIWNEKKLLK